jgi:hypothetical protein
MVYPELGTEKELESQKKILPKILSKNITKRKTVMRTDVWNDLTEKWDIVDMEDPYVTQTQYMESVWWILKNL